MGFVSIIIGSKSDYDVMSECVKTLEKFGVKHELIISSAHRSPERTKDYVKSAEAKGAEVFIAAAGMAAHLAGAIAAITTKPVIGVPCSNKRDINDSLLTMIQMPPGVPVGTVGSDNGRNAAILAGEILGITNDKIEDNLKWIKYKTAEL